MTWTTGKGVPKGLKKCQRSGKAGSLALVEDPCGNRFPGFLRRDTASGGPSWVYLPLPVILNDGGRPPLRGVAPAGKRTRQPDSPAGRRPRQPDSPEGRRPRKGGSLTNRTGFTNFGATVQLSPPGVAASPSRAVAPVAGRNPVAAPPRQGRGLPLPAPAERPPARASRAGAAAFRCRPPTDCRTIPPLDPEERE
jgi:hypothetical protein